MYDFSDHSPYLAHYGVKGMRWGVRRYQYPDGKLTPAGERRYSTNKRTGVAARTAQAMLDRRDNRAFKKELDSGGLGKNKADTWLKKGTSLYRIQSKDSFEDFAFYATHDKHDVEQYTGLFGKNLKARANAAARAAEKKGAENAKELRDTADGMKIYQLRLANTKKLKVPSDDNASHIVGELIKDKDFHDDLVGSLQDSAAKMRRPQQQKLFKEAIGSLSKDPGLLSRSEKSAVYKALNLSLTNHNEQQIRMQDKFYGELKKNGYSALIDLNDREFSSYHAKSPVIVFDTSKVMLQSITEVEPKRINQLYKVYNKERMSNEAKEQTFGSMKKAISTPISRIENYAVEKMNDYLLDRKRA